MKKLINLGSSCIYPKNAPNPIKEEYLLTSEFEKTNEAYALAKVAALKTCGFYNQEYGTNFISLMPPNLYGENDNFNMETAHLLPMVVRRFHLAKLFDNNDFEGIKKDFSKNPYLFLVVLFLLIIFAAHLRNNEMRTDTNLIPFNALSFSSMMMRMCR